MSRISYVESRLPTDKEITKKYNVKSFESYMLDEMQKKMLDIHPSNWKKGFNVTDIQFDNLHYMTNSDYRIYSSGIFIEGVAVDDNWIEQDLLILDIDDGMSILEALEFFGEYKALITTTRSHQKDKNGVTCDRFRVIIPFSDTYRGSSKEYRETMNFILSNRFKFTDNKCKDPSRIYFGKSNAEYKYTRGVKTFDFDYYIKKVNNLKKFRAVYVPKIKQTYSCDGEKIDWYRNNWLNDKMKSALKVDSKFVEGSRNTSLYSYAKFFKDMGMTDAETMEIVYWINAGQLDDKEIENTIFKSLKIRN